MLLVDFTGCTDYEEEEINEGEFDRELYELRMESITTGDTGTHGERKKKLFQTRRIHHQDTKKERIRRPRVSLVRRIRGKEEEAFSTTDFTGCTDEEDKEEAASDGINRISCNRVCECVDLVM
ncbi:hypothetical protein HZA56_06305 [Candidatus Poribacteria bacterium]|nr:hypothetical protein [Candidatus Poribacteria bacterium]